METSAVAHRPELAHREVLFEFHRIGNAVRVAALDPATNTEVSLLGPPGCGEAALKRVALGKLAYVLRSNRQASNPFD
jgi:hypothetical protein